MGRGTRATRLAVAWNLITFLVIVAALAIQLSLVIRGSNVLVETSPPGTATRVIRFFSYFTVQSNILVAATALTLVIAPRRDGRIWRVVRLDALIGIAVTGVIYVTLLRPVVNLHGIAATTDVAFHYLAPLLAVIGWLLFGPRPRITDSVLPPALIWPAAYVLYTVAHGAASGWYPYPFVDVTDLGYPTVLRNGVLISVLLLGAAYLFMVTDRVLPTGRDDAREPVRVRASAQSVGGTE